jgi:hypothetical protein
VSTRLGCCKGVLKSIVSIASFVIHVAQYRRALCWDKGELGYVIVGEWAELLNPGNRESAERFLRNVYRLYGYHGDRL